MSQRQAIAFQFTEEMKGYLGAGQHACLAGYEAGQADGTWLNFRLTIKTADLDAFIVEPEHTAQAIGYVESPLVGGRRPVLKGLFNLFASSGDRNEKTMLYRLHFETADGQPMTLSGTKFIQNNPGPDLWADTTTLHTNLFAGWIEADQETKAPLLASGLLHIELADFARQLTTFRAEAEHLSDRLAAIARFGEFFAGELWKVHGLPRHHRPEPTVWEIPRYTLEGVREAAISTHYTSTGDGLGISLLRFQRAPCRDVVLLIPGLTASSDMFFMPEHENLVNTLLDAGFGDVWALDGRISNRHSYNLSRHRYTVDDVALYDNPAAIAAIRAAVGPEVRLHIISHCLGALSIAMSVFARVVDNISSLICNGVALTPSVNPIAKLKLRVGPFLAEHLLGLDYLNPNWAQQPGLSPGKLLAKGVSLFHRECDNPACHMTSFMWGYGFPVLFKHENLHDVTHRRTGDLFGGSGLHYYRHVLKMVQANNTAVKYAPQDARYRALPDNYLQHAREIRTPMLLVAGQENALFGDSNILCHERLEQIVPGRHQLALIPGYGHADVIIGKAAARDVYPRFIEFIKRQIARE